MNKLSLDKIAHLQIAMGNQCNQHCIFCYQEDRSTKSKIDDKIWKYKLSSVYPYLESVTILGGEPTIMNNVKELTFLIYNKYSNIKLQTISNGRFFDDTGDHYLLRGGRK